MLGKKFMLIGPSVEEQGIGGVTIHVQRLRDYLAAHHFENEFKNYKDNTIGGILRAIRKADIVHIHVSHPGFMLFLTICSRMMKKNVIITLHGNYGRFGKANNLFVRSAMRIATVPIAINEKSYEACKKFNKRAVLIPAFIPPQKEEKLQDDIQALVVNLHKSGKKIVSTNAYNISHDKNGNDTYGIDFLVEYFKDSKEYTLLVSDPSGNYKKRHEKERNKEDESVIFIDYPHPYYELLKHVDYFVRNTSTDGDALSVKEALYLGVPALCTDVVDRPEGVRLYIYSNAASFEMAMKTPAEGNML